MNTGMTRRSAVQSCAARVCATVVIVTLLGAALGSIAQAAAEPSGTAPATHRLLTDQDSSTLKRRLREWFAAFSAKDYAALGDYFAAPYTEVGNRTFILNDMAAVRRLWQRTREGLDGTDYSHTEAIAIRVIPRSATLALLNIHWRRVNKDGSTLNEGSEFYFATKASGQWRFNGGMSQDLAEYQAAGRVICRGAGSPGGAGH